MYRRVDVRSCIHITFLPCVNLGYVLDVPFFVKYLIFGWREEKKLFVIIVVFSFMILYSRLTLNYIMYFFISSWALFQSCSNYTVVIVMSAVLKLLELYCFNLSVFHECCYKATRITWWPFVFVMSAVLKLLELRGFNSILFFVVCVMSAVKVARNRLSQSSVLCFPCIVSSQNVLTVLTSCGIVSVPSMIEFSLFFSSSIAIPYLHEG